ncbi:MAG TPA: Nif3-like dinuclear metal center hexameric protein [Flavilitoribacter sp.]|nr:Nif3-like dinuclear metal center hexameric protein [Flavilitoribacter sp.]HMQ89353.1 Nif3-like dinuclear metal center hexameric protein [Flavilitoribacter sp.]
MTQLRQLIRHLEQVAPPVYQESYDNAGLITGNPDQEVTGVLVCLDSTEAVIREAAAEGCNVVVAHHPIIFKGLKRLTGQTYVERTVIEAIRHGIAVYAIHTNLDNVYHQGVNSRIAEKLGLINTRILAPKKELFKLNAVLSENGNGALQEMLAQAGAVNAGFLNHYSGEPQLTRVEAYFEKAALRNISSVLEQYAAAPGSWDIHPVDTPSPMIGSGMVGELAAEMSENDFLAHLKARMRAGCVRHTKLLDKPVKRVAVCGGSGGFLLRSAIAGGADFFVTADYKYHEFFDADGKIVIADIGHYESEQFTIELLGEIIRRNFSNFAVRLTKTITNPVFYF